MSNPVERPGVYRGLIIGSKVKTAKDSKAVAVAIEAALSQWWDSDGKVWYDWASYDIVAEGSIWIVKRDGALNEQAVRSLVRFAGWDGSFASIADGSWQPMRCQLLVKFKTFQGKTSLEIDRVLDHDADPEKAEAFAISPHELKMLESEFGQSIRCIAATCRMGDAAPSGKPATPPAAPAAPPAAPAAPQQPATRPQLPSPAAAGNPSLDDLPF